MESIVKKTGCFFDPFHLFPNPFLQSRGNEVHAMSHLISCPNGSGHGFFLKTELSARQAPISRCCCKRGVILSTEQTSHMLQSTNKLVLQVRTAQPALEQ